MVEQRLSANPYIAGSPVTHAEMFFGRNDVFQFIQEALIGRHQDNIIVLYGQRRTGKTSVLYQMHRHIDSLYIPILVDLQGLSLASVNDFFWELAMTIRRALQRERQISDLPRPRREEYSEDPFHQFVEEFLPSVLSAVGDHHLLLMFDESTRLEEQVTAGKLDAQIFDLLRSLMQHSPRLNFIFSIGSRFELIQKEYSLLFNVALYKEISFLNREDGTALITQPTQELHEYEEEAINRVLEVTSGHAYYTQLLCHSLFGQWQRNPKPKVTAEDVDSVLGEVVERAIANLKFDWGESSPAEQLVLAACATMGKSNSTPLIEAEVEGVFRQYGINLPHTEVVNALKTLTSRELMFALPDGGYRFAVDLFRMWVHQSQKLEWVREELADFIRTLPEAPAADEIAAPLPKQGVRLWTWALLLGAVGAVSAFLFLPVSPVSLFGSSGPAAGEGPGSGEVIEAVQLAPAVHTFPVSQCDIITVIADEVAVEACVQQVEELEDESLRFTVSWGALITSPQHSGVTKASDEGNNNLFILDEAGTLYNFTNLGGAAKDEVVIKKDETVFGWFLFPPVPGETRRLSFLDNEAGIRIDGIILERPR